MLSNHHLAKTDFSFLLENHNTVRSTKLEIPKLLVLLNHMPLFACNLHSRDLGHINKQDGGETTWGSITINPLT